MTLVTSFPQQLLFVRFALTRREFLHPQVWNSDQQVLIQPQVGVHIEQVPQPPTASAATATAAEAASKKCASAVWLKFISSYKPVF